jgi:hypothetical protein
MSFWFFPLMLIPIWIMMNDDDDDNNNDNDQ